MTNERIAQLVGDFCFYPTKNEREFAIQLFIEKTILPSNCEKYTAETMGEFILKFINQTEETQRLKDGLKRLANKDTGYDSPFEFARKLLGEDTE